MTDAVPDVNPAEGSAVPGPSAPSNVVDVGPCRCPRTPHENDFVTLYPEVTLPLGVAATAVIRNGGGVAAVYGGLAEVYLQLGIASWTFIDERGDPEPIIADNIVRLLPFNGGGLAVADAADDLYAAALLRPLAQARSRSSNGGRTGGSTSASLLSGPKSPKHSARSSRNGTAGKRSRR